MHRVAAIGIVLRHSGQSRVVTSTSRWNRAVILAIGATIRKYTTAAMIRNVPPREVEIPVRGSVAAVVALEEFGEPLRLLGAEPDDSTRLTPWFLERVTHISDDGLGRRLP